MTRAERAMYQHAPSVVLGAVTEIVRVEWTEVDSERQAELDQDAAERLGPLTLRAKYAEPK